MSKEFNAKMAEYHKEVHELWLKTIMPVAALCIVISVSLTWGVMQFSEQSSINWLLPALCLFVISMILPIKMLYPERPTEESIAHDRVLNAIGQKFCETKNNVETKL